MQLRLKIFYLCLGQLGSIATFSMVLQSRHTTRAVRPTPAHQTALASPGHVSHLLRRVVGAIQSNSQEAAPCWVIFALRIRVPQFLDLLFRQLKPSLGPVPIPQHLSVLSIRPGRHQAPAQQVLHLLSLAQWLAPYSPLRCHT